MTCVDDCIDRTIAPFSSAVNCSVFLGDRGVMETADDHSRSTKGWSIHVPLLRAYVLGQLAKLRQRSAVGVDPGSLLAMGTEVQEEMNSVVDRNPDEVSGRY